MSDNTPIEFLIIGAIVVTWFGWMSLRTRIEKLQAANRKLERELMLRTAGLVSEASHDRELTEVKRRLDDLEGR